MLRDAMHSLFQEPITELYPVERHEAPPALRGKLHWSPKGCTGCQLCVKDCPAEAINLITIDKASKRFVMEYHVDRCVYCGQCSQNCRFDNITMVSDEWELAYGDRSQFTVYYGEPGDVEIALARQAEANAPAVAETP